MSHHVTDKEVKEKILMRIPVLSSIKGTPILDNYMKERLLGNKRALTLNHEEALKGIHDKVNHVFGSLLPLLGITKKKDKRPAIQELSKNNGDVPQC